MMKFLKRKKFNAIHVENVEDTSDLTTMILGPVQFPKSLLQKPSHRIFGHMHEVLNVDKK